MFRLRLERNLEASSGTIGTLSNVSVNHPPWVPCLLPVELHRAFFYFLEPTMGVSTMIDFKKFEHKKCKILFLLGDVIPFVGYPIMVSWCISYSTAFKLLNFTIL